MKEEFKYLDDKEFEANKLYLFLHPLGWTFESTVAQDVDKTGNLSGNYFTTNEDNQKFKATTLLCKIK